MSKLNAELLSQCVEDILAFSQVCVSVCVHMCGGVYIGSVVF